MRKRSDLHTYQLTAIEKAKANPNIALFFTMGCGKTCTALTIAKEVWGGATLVLAPKNVADGVWQREAKQWEHLHKLKFSSVMGTPAQRLAALNSSADFYITNIENAVWLFEQNIKFDNIILDESQKWKDASTKRWKALKPKIKEFKHRMAMSGTPCSESVQDLFTQVGFLDLGDRLGKTLTKFRDTYLEPAVKNWHTGQVYKYKAKEGSIELIQDKIKDIAFSLKASDYLQLPPKTNIYHELDFTPEQKRVYEQLQKDMVAEVSGETITAATAATLANKLLQTTSGFNYTEEKDTVEFADTKIQRIIEILEEAAGSPCCIFYWFQATKERLSAAIPQAMHYNPEIIEDWNAGRIPVMLGQVQSLSTGLNLQVSGHPIASIIYAETPWSSEIYSQSVARIHRQGQETPVIVHHLSIKNTIDQRVIDVLEGKINLQDAVMSAIKLK